MEAEKIEVKNVLEKSRKLLQSRPELSGMDFNAILDELDDGPQEMTHNRWGVLAWIVVNSINPSNISDLVERLSKRDDEFLTAKYVGCILQIYYHINMEEFILEADRSGKFDRLVFYASDVWAYVETLHRQYILPILNLLEKHSDHSSYQRFLNNYAVYISRMNAQQVAFDLIGEASNQTQYLFIKSMCPEWYKEDSARANDALESLCKYANTWSKRLAIGFACCSLKWDICVFQSHFLQFKRWADKSVDLNLELISLCVKYVSEISGNATMNSNQIYLDVLDYIKATSEATLAVKQRFIQSICAEEETPQEIKDIVFEMSKHSFQQDGGVLCAMAQYLFGKAREDNWEEILQIMRNMFVVNHYSSKYRVFFENFNILRSELARHEQQIIHKALQYILQGGVQELFFGVGLLVWVEGNQKSFNLANPESFIETLTYEQLTRIIKAMYYITYDGEATCYMAFWLVPFLKTPEEPYFIFCANELFTYYPITMYETAEKHKSSADVREAYLAEIIERKYVAFQNEQNIGQAIRDLHPSANHQVTYYKAQQEINSKITEDARERSIFAQISETEVIKYGKRMAHVAFSKKEKFYQVSPYMICQYSKEFPKSYLEDPVDFEFNRRAFLAEVEQNAVDH